MSTTEGKLLADYALESLKNFKRISSGIDITEIKDEISSQSSAWLIDTSRQSNIRVQRNTESIFCVRRVDKRTTQFQ